MINVEHNPAHIGILKKYVTNNPKLICTVRHPLDILASFITLFHKDGTLNFIDKAMIEKKIPITDDNRCHYMMNPEWYCMGINERTRNSI